MENLRELGVDPSYEFLLLLVFLPLHTMLSFREDIFKSVLAHGLASSGDTLLSRRDSRKKPLPTRLYNDIISFLICLKNQCPIPRSLLKNGKCCKDYFNVSRSFVSQGPPPTTPPNLLGGAPSSTDADCLLSTHLSDSFNFTAIMKDINLLRVEVNALKIDVGVLHRQKQPTSVPSTYHIKMASPVSSATADPCMIGILPCSTRNPDHCIFL